MSQDDPRRRKLDEQRARTAARIPRLHADLAAAQAAQRASPQERAGALTCPDCGQPVASWDDDDAPGTGVLLVCANCGRCEYRHDDSAHPLIFADLDFAHDVWELGQPGVTGKRRRKLVRRVRRFADTKLRPGAPRLPRPGEQPGEVDAKGRPLPPMWEGVHSFRPAWDACWEVMDGAPLLGRGRVKAGGSAAHGEEGEPVEVISGAEAFCIQGVYALHAAHALWIGPQQLGALPLANPAELIEWGRTTSLPFPTMYLDFTSASGPAVLDSGLKDHANHLYGAVVFQPKREGYGYGEPGMPRPITSPTGNPDEDTLSGTTATEGLTIIPFGAAATFPDGEVRVAAWGNNEPSPVYAPLGALTLESDLLPASDVVTGDLGVGHRAGSQWMKGSAVVMARVRVADIIGTVGRTFKVGEPWKMPPTADRDLGLVLGGSGGVLQDRSRDRTYPRAGDPDSVLDPEHSIADAEVVSQAEVVLRGALQALKALYLLDSANVELDEAPVSRPVRKQARRKGHKIAKVVRVHLGHRRASKPTSSGGSRNFDHRFDRRGYYRHVTRGSHYREPFIKPCNRDDDAHRATGGYCRREVVPPTVVGDEELPYVPKSRIWDTTQEDE